MPKKPMTFNDMMARNAREHRAMHKQAEQRQKAVDTLPRRERRSDGWQNLANGLGRLYVDPRNAGTVQFNQALREKDAEEFCAADSMAHRIVWKLPEDAVRGWVKFKHDDENMQDLMKPLQVPNVMKKAWGWARQYGGSGLYVNTGIPVHKLIEPLDLKKVQSIKSLVVFNRWELWVQTPDVEWNINSPNYGMPRHYWLQPRKSQGRILVPIHHTHIIRFDGKPMGNLLPMENNYWSDSVLTSLWEVLRDYNLAHGGIAKVMMDFRKLVWKMAGLAEAVMAGQEGNVQNRMSVMQAMSAASGMEVIDPEDAIEILAHSLQGVPDALRTLKDRVQAATDMPHSILFNEGPGGGLNTGEGKSEFRAWYDHVGSQQKEYLQPKFERFLEVLHSSKTGPTKGVLPGKVPFEWPALWQLTELEKSTVSKNQSDAFAIDIEAGLCSSREARAIKYPQFAADRPDVNTDENAEGVGPGTIAQAMPGAPMPGRALKAVEPKTAPGEPAGQEVPAKAQPKTPSKAPARAAAASNPLEGAGTPKKQKGGDHAA